MNIKHLSGYCIGSLTYNLKIRGEVKCEDTQQDVLSMWMVFKAGGQEERRIRKRAGEGMASEGKLTYMVPQQPHEHISKMSDQLC